MDFGCFIKKLKNKDVNALDYLVDNYSNLTPENLIFFRLGKALNKVFVLIFFNVLTISVGAIVGGVDINR